MLIKSKFQFRLTETGLTRNLSAELDVQDNFVGHINYKFCWRYLMMIMERDCEMNRLVLNVSKLAKKNYNTCI